MLTYYQAVELMSCLPALLSPVNDTFNNEKAENEIKVDDVYERESWYSVNRSMTANGEFFTD